MKDKDRSTTDQLLQTVAFQLLMILNMRRFLLSNNNPTHHYICTNSPRALLFFLIPQIDMCFPIKSLTKNRQ